jgi:Membrane bound O-acyl transferase family
MSGYVPTTSLTASLIGLVWLGTLLAGFGLTRLPCGPVVRFAGWLLGIAAVTGCLVVCDGEPPGVRMLAICVSLLLAMKAVVTVEAQGAGAPRLSAGRWFAFALLWLGMRPGLFADAGRRSLTGGLRLTILGAKRFALGGACLSLIAAVDKVDPALSAQVGLLVAITIVGCIGLSLILHFGLINIAAGLWRFAGVDCRALFRAPLLAKSLADFWGRRWNLAFSEMAAVTVARPLTPLLGARGAVAAAFLFSGILHELAISVPVRAGYGGPFLYFALQALLVSIEKRLERDENPINRRPWLGRLWTFAWLTLPLPLLFHAPFITQVIWPLLGIR